MTTTVEIRALRLRPGAWPEFRRHWLHGAYPLLEAAGFDVVAFGRSDAEPAGAWVIRAFASAAERLEQERAYYGSPAWRDGPRAPILACVDAYVDAILELDDATVEGCADSGSTGRKRATRVRSAWSRPGSMR
jgi:hypothetical protein